MKATNKRSGAVSAELMMLCVIGFIAGAFITYNVSNGTIRLTRSTPRITATCPAQALMFNDGRARIVRLVLYENGACGWQECEANPYRDEVRKMQEQKKINADAAHNKMLDEKRATKSTVPMSTNSGGDLTWEEMKNL